MSLDEALSKALDDRPLAALNIEANNKFNPSVEFDGSTGTAQTGAYESEPENFDDFLRDAGLDPTDIEVVPPVRTSRWQRYDGEWLTSYRFNLRRKSQIGTDLPMLLAEAKKKFTRKPLKDPQPKCLVVLWSDLQVGKVDFLGNSESLIERVQLMQDRLVALIKAEKPDRVIFCDLGDTIEGFDNKANMAQLQGNDLSIMDMVDLAAKFALETLRAIVKLVPDVTYASIGSNHCQWRKGGQVVGKATDDWGVFIGRYLARISHAAGLGIKFVEPQPHDESLAIDVFGDGFHILGMVHGHQVGRPEQVKDWWKGQSFGSQPVSAATLLVHGHWHHLRVTEVGVMGNGNSRFIVMGATLDNGSGWFRKVSGESSTPGLVTLMLEQGVPFTGKVEKL